MRTFEEVKEILANEGYRLRNVHQSELLKPGLREREIENAYKRRLVDIEKILQNLDEVATIEIGDSVNKIIEQIKEKCKINYSDYLNNFHEFCGFHIMGTIKRDDNRFGARAKSECECLGITLDDLQCLKGQNPVTDFNFGDQLRERVNYAMGTSIPMASELTTIEKECSFNSMDDEITRANKVVRLMEAKRDAGLLKEGHFSYNQLVYNEYYQNNKVIATGRKL